MKKILIVLANVLIMSAILIFVLQYANNARSRSENEQITDFERTAASVERATANYLEEEQHICDTWASYINSVSLTSAEAMEFLRISLHNLQPFFEFLFPLILIFNLRLVNHFQNIVDNVNTIVAITLTQQCIGTNEVYDEARKHILLIQHIEHLNRVFFISHIL